jgi:hypothetical protein
MVGRLHVDVNDGGVRVLGRIGQRFRDHLVGGDLRRSGSRATPRTSSSTGIMQRRASAFSADSRPPPGPRSRGGCRGPSPAGVQQPCHPLGYALQLAFELAELWRSATCAACRSRIPACRGCAPRASTGCQRESGSLHCPIGRQSYGQLHGLVSNVSVLVCPAGGQSQYRLAGTRARRLVTGG